MTLDETMVYNLAHYIELAHQNAKDKGFWDDTKEASPSVVNLKISTQLMNLVSEVAEANEALRKDDMDNFAEEMADILIRWADLMGFLEINPVCINKKMKINAERPKLHGKQF